MLPEKIGKCLFLKGLGEEARPWENGEEEEGLCWATGDREETNVRRTFTVFAVGHVIEVPSLPPGKLP